MSTARAIPFEEDIVPAKNISIMTGPVASPYACIVQTGQSVTFTNNCGNVINIQFVANPVIPAQKVFNDVIGLSPTVPNNTNTQTPQVANGSVNYYVYIGGVGYGPYAIQVGNGPMYIQVSYNQSLGMPQCTPDPAVIPLQGSVEMVSTDFNYSVQWPSAGGDPFGQPITSVSMGLPNNMPHQATTGIADYSYRVTRVMITEGTGNGGGTVKVKST